MLGNTYERQHCSAARALEIVGERWSLLILRDALFRGFTRFSDFQRSLAIAPNILAKRLEGFVAAGLLEHRAGDEADAPSRYLPTNMGMDLKPVIIALTEWGDRWRAPEGPPVQFQHEGCGGHVKLLARCSECGISPGPQEIAAIPVERRSPRPKRSGRRGP